jgi:hypothetical protein
MGIINRGQKPPMLSQGLGGMSSMNIHFLGKKGLTHDHILASKGVQKSWKIRDYE